MSRGAVLLGVLALAGLASGVGFALSRHGGSAGPASAAPAIAAPAIVTAFDPAWCGKPPGSKTIGELGDASACGKLSLTGTAPGCVFWAQCAEVRFEIDCTSAGPGRCRCDGESGRTVPYDPSFCALDASHPQPSLRAILAASAVACRWAPR